MGWEVEKTKAIMKIESFSHKDGTLLLSVSDLGVRARIKGLVEWCEKKYANYIKLEMSPPYKPRTTGKESQNNKIWGLISQIVDYTGHDISDIEDYAKLRAIKRGYPYRMNELTGEIKPLSQKDINTVEAGYLIDELYQIASEMEVPIVED